MKKTIYILLVFLCIFTLSSCSKLKKGDVVSQNDGLDFLKEKGLYIITEFDYDYELADKKYEYEFTVKVKEKSTTQKRNDSVKVSAKGRASLDIREGTTYFKYYVKGSTISVSKTPTISEKLSLNKTVKEEVYRTLTEDGTKLYYIDQKLKSKSTYESYKKETKIKTKYNKSELSDFVPDFEDTLKSILYEDLYTFIDGKKCTIIYSDDVSKTTIEMWFDGDAIIKLRETREAHNGKYVVEMKFKDIDSIAKPKNASDYKDIDKTDE